MADTIMITKEEHRLNATPLASNNISLNNINHHYYKISGKYYYFEFPSRSRGIDENTSFCIVEGGTGTTQMTAGRSQGSPMNVVAGADRNGNENTIFVNCNAGTTGMSGDIVDEIAETTGADRTNRVYMGHSASGFQVTKAANDYLKREKEEGRETKTMLVLNDPTYGGSEDPILQDGAKAENFEDSYVVSMGPTSLGYSGKVKESDLQELGKAGARVLLIGGNYQHTDFNDKLSPALGLYDQHSVNLANVPGLTFWTIDKNGKPVKLTYEQAQAYNDASVGRLDMFNQGFLSKSTGEYVLTAGEFKFALSEEELDKMAMNFERGDKSFEEYLQENYRVDREGNLLDKDGNIVGTTRGAPNNDNVPPTLREVGIACEALQASLNDIGRHMQSFGNIPGLNETANGKLSSYLSEMNAFPSGVSTGGLQACMDNCVNKLGRDLENAYNATANLYGTMAAFENAAPSYYPSNTYANAGTSASANANNFASDI